MTSRQESLVGILILACAMTFLLLTNVSSSNAQVSSRRGSTATSQAVLHPPPAPPKTMLPQATRSTTRSPEQIASPIAGPTNPPPARMASAKSPMSYQIRSQLDRQRSFQTSSNASSNRSRAIYDIRNQLKQQDSQTVEELLEELDRKAVQTKPTTQRIEPALDPPPADQDLVFWDETPEDKADSNIDVEFAVDPNSNDSLGTSVNGLSNGANDLAFFELLAIQNHPTLNASAARILTARYEALQAGLHPNPSLGLFVDEAGNDGDLGLWGAFLQRTHVRGNKLALGQAIKNLEANVLEVEFEIQAIRISTDVRIAFYKLLIAKEKMDLIDELLGNQQLAVTKSNQLFPAGETPPTVVLQSELQLQRTQVQMSQVEIDVQNAWRELTSVVGDLNLEPREIVGDINAIVAPVSFEECRTHILNSSPEIQSARAELERVRATIEREIAQTVPNYRTQLTVGRDSTTEHFFTGIQLQIPLQISDQNQGNIAAAKSRLVAAQNDLRRIELDLSKRLASEHRRYESALTKTNLYLHQLLPKSKQTLELLEQGYPSEVSFLQLSTAQKNVIDINLEYLDTLSLLWNSRLKIEGLLLDDSLAK